VAPAPVAPVAPPAPETPPAPDAAAMAAPMEPAPAPVAEGKDDNEDPPFDPDPPKKNPIAKAGKHGLGHSTAKHLAQQGIKAAIAKAKKAGATLETKIDFGNKEMTLHDAIKGCGLSLEECGFDASEGEGGVDQILKSIAGFWNKENRNFTIGGTRAKTKVIKGFKDGEFPNATPEDVKQVVSMIEKMDPSSNEHNQIMKLAGVQGHEQSVGESPDAEQMAKLNNILSQMKIKFGDNEIDMSNPDQAGEKLKGIMGGMMQGVQGQIPNQNVQFPGGQMNPSDMMKQIMQKINFGK
jgi:hypothetical protein